MKLVVKYIMWCMVLAAPLTSSAQNTLSSYDFMTSKKIVKLDFSSMFSATPTLAVEVESFVNEKLSLQFGVGIVPSFFQPTVGRNTLEFDNVIGMGNNNGFDNLRGYRLSAESRFYAFKKPTRYLATGFSFRHIVVRDRDVQIGMKPFENSAGMTEFEYFQANDMRFHQFRTTLDLKYGFQKDLGTNFVFDLNVGLRLGTVNVQSRSEIPEGGTLMPNWNGRLVLVDNYKRSRITPTLGFKLGYKL